MNVEQTIISVGANPFDRSRGAMLMPPRHAARR